MGGIGWQELVVVSCILLSMLIPVLAMALIVVVVVRRSARNGGAPSNATITKPESDAPR